MEEHCSRVLLPRNTRRVLSIYQCQDSPENKSSTRRDSRPVPPAEVEDKFSTWSTKEIEAFISLFEAMGKNFDKIAAELPQKTAKDCVEFYYRRKQDKTTILPELRLKAKMLNLQDREGSPAPKKQCSFDLRVPETDTRCPRTQLLFLRQSSYERRQTSAYFRVFQHSWPPSSSEPSVAPAFCDLVARLPCIASSSLVDSLRCWQAGRITGQDFQRCLANDIMPNLLPTSTPSIHLPISSPHVCDTASSSHCKGLPNRVSVATDMRGILEPHTDVVAAADVLQCLAALHAGVPQRWLSELGEAVLHEICSLHWVNGTRYVRLKSADTSSLRDEG